MCKTRGVKLATRVLMMKSYAHRCLVVAHCPVLKAMLTSGFKEGSGKVNRDER